MITTGHFVDQQEKQHLKAIKYDCVFNYKTEDKFPTNYVDACGLKKKIFSVIKQTRYTLCM